MGGHRVGIVIPAFNESKTILGIVGKASKYGVAIVVDDGSSDDTAALAAMGGAVVVSHKTNRGYDAALNSGFEKAAQLGCETVISLDADGQHSPFLIQKFITEIDLGNDLVLGVRSSLPRFAEQLFSQYTNVFFGIKDPLCGMKGYRLALYKELGYFDSYRSIGTELMFFAARRGFRISQVPFNVNQRDGQSRFGSIIGANCKILRAFILSIWYRK